jgi:hypothetical protein
MQDLFAEQLKALRAASLDRQLSEIGNAQRPELEIAGRRLLNFSSNDYLGLANDPRLRKAAIAAINEFGVGAGASRRLLLWERINLMRQLLLQLDVGRWTLGVGGLNAANKRSTLNSESVREQSAQRSTHL